MTQQIKFTLNGTAVVSERHPGVKLLDVLREDFADTGVKCGCREGECGACSVLLDGLVANSCMSLSLCAGTKADAGNTVTPHNGNAVGGEGPFIC